MEQEEYMLTNAEVGEAIALWLANNRGLKIDDERSLYATKLWGGGYRIIVK